MTKNNTLYIDSNEPKDMQTTAELTIQDRDTGADTEIKGLKTGDFVYQDVVIERKEASDLAQSIKDRRLKEQTLRMLEDFEHQYIIVEGDPYNLSYSNIHNNAFIGTMVSRSHAGTRIIYTPDKEGTAYALNKIIEKHGGGEEKTEELKKTNADTEDVQVAMLTCVKGISKEKAEDIIEQVGFGSICSMRHNAFAPEDKCKAKFEKVEGIGAKLSQRIIDAFK